MQDSLPIPLVSLFLSSSQHILSVYIFLFLSILPPPSFLHCYTLRLIVLTCSTEDSIPSRPQKRHQHESDDNREREKQRAAVSDFVDGIAREKLEKKGSDNNDNAGMREGGGLLDEDEIKMMKQLGIPTGFNSIQGKPVLGVNVSRVRAVTKWQPRQHMNRRGRFNRPLPLERNH